MLTSPVRLLIPGGRLSTVIGMGGQWTQWWLDWTDPGDWQFPAARMQGFRLIGGSLIGTADSLNFVPNRFEARFGGVPHRIERTAIASARLGLRRLRITTSDGSPAQTFWINRRRTALQHLEDVLSV